MQSLTRFAADLHQCALVELFDVPKGCWLAYSCTLRVPLHRVKALLGTLEAVRVGDASFFIAEKPRTILLITLILKLA